MAKVTAKDLYMNFADVSVEFDSSNTTTLVSAKKDTGLSIRGGLAWLIHSVEIVFSGGESGPVRQYIALSTLSGLAALPDLGDQGLICKAERHLIFQTSGAALIHEPHHLHYLPPIPLAAPEIHIYANTNTNMAALQGETVEARIGFTTIPLDTAVYTEIAETWGW